MACRILFSFYTPEITLKKLLMEKPRHMQILNESNKDLSSVVIWEKSYLWKELAAAVTSILRGRDVTGC